MNIHRNCLLTLAIITTVSFSSLSASELSDSTKKIKPTAAASSTVTAKEVLLRFGRNVMTEGAKLRQNKTACVTPSKTCRCKTTSSTVSCETRVLKRR